MKIKMKSEIKKLSPPFVNLTLCVIPFVYHLVIASEVETEFNRECTDEKKHVNLILEFSINNNRDYS